MNSITIFHNANCSKSREALEYLQARGYSPRIVNYLETPLAEPEIRQLLRQLGIAPSSLVRASDFERLGLTPTSDPDELVQLIAEHPILMQRPIVVVEDRARIAKPANVIDDFLPPLEPT